MSQGEHGGISNKQANVGSGATGIGLGTALVVFAPKIITDTSIIELLQMASPTISVFGAFISKSLFIYLEKRNRLKRISSTTKHIDGLCSDENISPDYKSQLVNKKQELHMREIEIMSSGLFTDLEPSRVPNNSLKRTR